LPIFQRILSCSKTKKKQHLANWFPDKIFLRLLRIDKRGNNIAAPTPCHQTPQLHSLSSLRIALPTVGKYCILKQGSSSLRQGAASTYHSDKMLKLLSHIIQSENLIVVGIMKTDRDVIAPIQRLVSLFRTRQCCRFRQKARRSDKLHHLPGKGEATFFTP
jgi:hypothetical protein